MKIFSENKRYWRAILITIIFWLLMAISVKVLWPYNHLWLANRFFYGIAAFWIGQTLSKFVKLPKGVSNVLKVIGIIAIEIIYFELPKYPDIYQVGGSNLLRTIGIFTILGCMLPYVEEEKDRFWEWLTGFACSFLLVAFVTYMSNHYMSAGNFQVYEFRGTGIDQSAVEAQVDVESLSRLAKVANFFLIIPVLPAVYYFQKLALSLTIQGFLTKKND